MENYKLQNAANYKLQNTNYKTTIKAKLSMPQLIVYITQFFSVKTVVGAGKQSGCLVSKDYSGSEIVASFQWRTIRI